MSHVPDCHWSLTSYPKLFLQTIQASVYREYLLSDIYKWHLPRRFLRSRTVHTDNRSPHFPEVLLYLTVLQVTAVQDQICICFPNIRIKAVHIGKYSHLHFIRIPRLKHLQHMTGIVRILVYNNYFNLHCFSLSDPLSHNIEHTDHICVSNIIAIL